MVAVSQNRRRSGRPLDRGQIVDTALVFVAEEGIEALSMRRLARRLGVAPMSLYRHVDGKDALLGLVVEALADRLPETPAGGSWQDTVTATLTSLRRLLADHPGIGTVVTSRALFTPSVLRSVDRVLGALAEAGLDAAGAAGAFSTLWSFTVGSVVVEESLAAGQREPERVDAERERVVTGLAAAAGEAAPHVAGAAPHWLATAGDEAFADGLSVLLEGIGVRAAASLPAGRPRP